MMATEPSSRLSKPNAQECLEALEKSNLQETVKFSQELSRISCPLRPSLPPRSGCEACSSMCNHNPPTP